MGWRATPPFLHLHELHRNLLTVIISDPKQIVVVRFMPRLAGC